MKPAPKLARSRQRGVAGLLALLALALTALGWMLTGSLTPEQLRGLRDQEPQQRLAIAQDALIGAALAASAQGLPPLTVPLPDQALAAPTQASGSEIGTTTAAPLGPAASQLSTTPTAPTASHFDGLADGCLGSAARLQCLGRLPWKTLGLPWADSDQRDLLGLVPWYAVSGNLAASGCLHGRINPDLLQMQAGAYLCPSIGQLPYRWLTVRDARGNPITQRAAIVLLAPGKALADQQRASPSSDSYLDTVIVPADCAPPCRPGRYSNADLDDDYIVPDPASATANDRLLWITIDTLMAELSQHVAQAAANSLQQYWLASHSDESQRSLPFASPTGTAQSPQAGLLQGMLPRPGCRCTWTDQGGQAQQLCDCAFGFGAFAVTNGRFVQAQGSCSITDTDARRCVCHGAGGGFCRSIHNDDAAALPVAEPPAQSIAQPTAAPTTAPVATHTQGQDLTSLAGDFLIARGACTVVPAQTSTSTGPGSGSRCHCQGTEGWCETDVSRMFRDQGWAAFSLWTVAPGCTPGHPPGLCDDPSARLTLTGKASLDASLNPSLSPSPAITTSLRAAIWIAGPAWRHPQGPFAASAGQAQTRPSSRLADYLDSVENTNGDALFSEPAGRTGRTAAPENDLIWPLR